MNCLRLVFLKYFGLKLLAVAHNFLSYFQMHYGLLLYNVHLFLRLRTLVENLIQIFSESITTNIISVNVAVELIFQSFITEVSYLEYQTCYEWFVQVLSVFYYHSRFLLSRIKPQVAILGESHCGVCWLLRQIAVV